MRVCACVLTSIALHLDSSPHESLRIVSSCSHRTYTIFRSCIQSAVVCECGAGEVMMTNLPFLMFCSSNTCDFIFHCLFSPCIVAIFNLLLWCMFRYQPITPHSCTSTLESAVGQIFAHEGDEQLYIVADDACRCLKPWLGRLPWAW